MDLPGLSLLLSIVNGNDVQPYSLLGAADKEQAMDRDATREKIKANMEAEFLPEPSPDTLSQVDRRMANAAEYVAYHLGQIDKKLDRLIVLLESAAEQGKPQPKTAQ